MPLPPLMTRESFDEVEFLSWAKLHIEQVWVHDGPLAAEHRDHSFEGLLPAAWLIRRGTVTLQFNDTRYQAAAGQWVFPSGANGRARFSDDAELLSVRFVACWPDGSPLFSPGECPTLEASRCPELERAGRQLAATARSTLGDLHTAMRKGRSTLTAHLHLQHLFYRFLREYSRTMQLLGSPPQLQAERDERLPRALDFINQHTPGTIREVDIARHISLSVSQLNRLFTRRFGMSPKALMEHRRFQQASHELSYTQKPIKSIAYRLGFSSLPHFSRWFSRRAGQSPSSLRKSESQEK